jgi:peptidoglycan/xylan/chitin deacetylase (PgdA/CDA1 family)
LAQLQDYNAKATFFCIGDNIKKKSDAFQQIIQQGHRIGNHTFNHLNGWRTSEENYVKNTILAEQEIEKFKKEEIKFFRPPYGKITNSQAKKLVQLNYKIVMWDVLSGDFDETLSTEKCFKNVIKNTKAGSTIVFHDSIKASKNLKNVLPKVLKYYAEKGYRFKAL